MEFQLEEGITDVEAQRLIESDGGGKDQRGAAGDEEDNDNVVALGVTEEDQDQDPFTTRLYSLHQAG